MGSGLRIPGDVEQPNTLSGADLGSRWAQFVGITSVAGAAFFSPSDALAQQPLEAHPERLTAAQRAAARYLLAPSIDSIPSLVRSNTHVYYVRRPDGESPVPENQLQELARRLAGSTDYLIIVGGTDGYEFTPADGVTRYGKEAAGMYLGQKVYNLPAFADVTDNRTGTALGSANLFVLTLDPGQGKRGWMLSASRLAEHVGLTDEAHWMEGHRLFFIAVEDILAERFVDGVEKTRTRYHALLEAELKPRIDGFKKISGDALAAVGGAAGLLTQYESNLADAKGKFPGRAGDLFVPGDLDQLRSRASEARQALENKDFASAASFGAALTAALTPRNKALLEYSGAAATFTALGGRIGEAAKNEFAFTLGDGVQSASNAVSAARSSWLKGETAYATLLSGATAAVDELGSAVLKAKETYTLDEQRIRNLENTLGNIEKSEFRGGVESQLKPLGEKLVQVRNLWARKDSAYPALLTEAQNDIEQAQGVVTAAEDAAADASRNKKIMWGLLILAAGGGLTYSGRRIRGVGKIADEVGESVERYDAAVKVKDTQLDALNGLKERALMQDSMPVAFAPNSESARLAAEARTATNTLRLLQYLVKNEVMPQARAHLALGGWWNSTNYDNASGVMSNHALELTDEKREELRQVFAEDKGPLGALGVSLSEIANFKITADQIDAEHKRLSDAAEAALNKIVSARESISTKTVELAKLIGELEERAETLDNAAEKREGNHYAGIFTGASIRKPLVDALKEVQAECEKASAGDPVSVTKKIDAAVSAGSEAKKLADIVINYRAGDLPAIGGNAASLADADLACPWIATNVKGISTGFDALVARAAVQAQGGAAEKSEFVLREAFEKLQADVKEAVSLSARLTTIQNDDIRSAVTLVDMTRKELGEKLNLAPEKVLQEKESDPDDYIAEAGRDLASAKAAVKKGDLEEAAAKAGECDADISAVIRICAASQEAFSTYETTRTARKDHAEKLKEGLEEHGRILEAIRRHYAESVLEIRGLKKQEIEPGADAMVGNNVQEADKALDEGDKAVSNAEKAFKAGKLLEAAHELERAGACHRFTQNRMAEISTKQEELSESDRANADGVRELRQAYGELGQAMQNTRTTQATRDKFDSVLTPAYDKVTGLQDGAKRDPTIIAEKLEEAQEELESLQAAVKRDHAMYKEVQSSIETARQNATRAATLAQTTDRNDTPDSAATNAAQTAVFQLGKEVMELNRDFCATKHGDWARFDKLADDLNIQIMRERKIIETEDARGKAAAEAMEAAESALQSVVDWKGKYNIKINREAGKEHYILGKENYRNGRYDQATERFELAEDAAEKAVKKGNAAVEEEKDAREAARDDSDDFTSMTKPWSPSTSTWKPSSGGGGGGIFGGSRSGGTIGSIGGSSRSGGTMGSF